MSNSHETRGERAPAGPLGLLAASDGAERQWELLLLWTCASMRGLFSHL